MNEWYHTAYNISFASWRLYQCQLTRHVRILITYALGLRTHGESHPMTWRGTFFSHDIELNIKSRRWSVYKLAKHLSLSGCSAFGLRRDFRVRHCSRISLKREYYLWNTRIVPLCYLAVASAFWSWPLVSWVYNLQWRKHHSFHRQNSTKRITKLPDQRQLCSTEKHLSSMYNCLFAM